MEQGYHFSLAGLDVNVASAGAQDAAILVNLIELKMYVIKEVKE